MGERVVLHSDLNNCYASIECMLSNCGKYIALDVAARKIVMASFGEKSVGKAMWREDRRCDLGSEAEVSTVDLLYPPHMDQYLSLRRL